MPVIIGRRKKRDALESLEEAYAMLKSQRESETRSSKDRLRLFGSIAAQFVLFGKGERAIEIAEGIDDDTESMTALAQVASLLSAADSDELATQAVNAIPEDAQRTFALIGMSDAKARNEQKDLAANLLNEAMHLAETVPQLSSRASAYNEIASRFAKLDDDAGLESAVHGSFESILALRDDSIKSASLTELSAIADELELAPGENEIAYLRKLVAAANT
jgi:YesN/AraC family two-component response regulator